ncbi:MAG: hypothetical protein NC253_01525 [Ruminococcus sp.]|nr:hypothetical protein [Ruminococcus sp.]MCM1381155.1 hypothetical protein [Muribaculaceae bacterium]MCM1479646.1 hypothetical protein [Muribaculaceae bacterium]
MYNTRDKLLDFIRESYDRLERLSTESINSIPLDMLEKIVMDYTILFLSANSTKKDS